MADHKPLPKQTDRLIDSLLDASNINASMGVNTLLSLVKAKALTIVDAMVRVERARAKNDVRNGVDHQEQEEHLSSMLSVLKDYAEARERKRREKNRTRDRLLRDLHLSHKRCREERDLLSRRVIELEDQIDPEGSEQRANERAMRAEYDRMRDAQVLFGDGVGQNPQGFHA